MAFDLENTDNQIGTLVYEQPSLKKYGTMKEFTLGASGSSGDAMGSDRTSSPGDPRVEIPDGGADVNDTQFIFDGDGAQDRIFAIPGANTDADSPTIIDDAGGLDS